MTLFRRRKKKPRKIKKKKKQKIRKLFRPAGFLIDPKARKRARLNQPTRKPWELFFVDQPSRFDDQVGLFTNYEAGRVVKIHVIPAPWSRVFLYSILYAFVIGVTKFCVFYTFGKPNWIMANAPTAYEAELGPDLPGP